MYWVVKWARIQADAKEGQKETSSEIQTGRNAVETKELCSETLLGVSMVDYLDSVKVDKMAASMDSQTAAH
jgi:hypothetical protein